MRVRILVSFKDSVLDPQGQTVKNALHTMGYDAVKDVRQGKVFEIVIQLGAILAVCWEYRVRLTAVMRGIFTDGVDRLGSQAKTILITHLQQTGRFNVMDRDNLPEIKQEGNSSPLTRMERR